MFKRKLVTLACLMLPIAAYASFIETTLGTAVVNDATATYFNPAALVLMKNPQFIPIENIARFHSNFSGQTTQVATGLTDSGSSSATSYYNAPALYLGVPVTNRITLGFAVLTNNTGRDTEGNSIFRYVESSNTSQEHDVVPAIGIKLNEYFSLGAGLDLAYANFHLRPTVGFPQSNVPDSVNHNDCDGTAVGLDLGALVKLSPTTLLGLNYRSTTTYRLSGTSTYTGNPVVVSSDYHYKLRRPAHTALSINHFVSPKLGFIATIQYIQWSIIKYIHINGIATLVGTQPEIVDASVPHHRRDTLAFTLGSHYRITPKWVVRVAGTYNQSPGNSHYQMTAGDSIILGASTGYDINEVMSIDAGYAHAFVQDQNINIAGNRFMITGVNKGSRDSASIKLTFNMP